MPPTPTLVARTRELARLDFPTGSTPSGPSLALASAVAIIGSLLADAVVVFVGRRIFPSTSGYQHYHFGDYATLTVIGVIIACVAWPVVTRLTSHTRWMFSRMAVLVTLVLLLPDVALLIRGDSAEAVAVLVAMHLAIAVVTYHALVRLAPARARRVSGGRREGDGREVAARRG